MSPRRSAANARATREAIIDTAVDRASLEGLEGLTIGRLADELGMSKAGVIGHFGTKEALQLEALGAASDDFRRKVWDPASDREPGLERLRALMRRWIAYLDGDPYPGGCFLTAASSEFDGREGPVRDAVSETLARWHDVLAREAATALAAGELPPGEDPRQLAFELAGIALALNQARQLQKDRRAGARARRAVARILPR